MFDFEDNLHAVFEEDADAAFVEEELRKAVFVIEALGTFTLAEQMGWFRHEKAPQEFIDVVRKLTPASRGGLGQGIEAEAQWEGIVDDILADADDGFESLERMRAKLNELFTENAERTDSPA